MEKGHEQKRHHYKRYKGSQKEFYRWMVSEIEDFVPEIQSEDPLKRFYYLVDPNVLTSFPNPERKRLVAVKPQAEKMFKHEPNFSFCKFWKEFPSQLNENLMRFLDLKDIVMLIYTCKHFKETLDQESMWKFLQIRDFSSLPLNMLRDDTKDRVSEKLYYKYLYLSRISGVPYHTGYFKIYGSSDLPELSEFIVDILCPKTEIIKNYVDEILTRNQCKTFDLKLSWLKEKNEICLWNGNSSLEFKKSEMKNEVTTVKKFDPCFIKRYSMVDEDEDEEIVNIFLLEDKYLVVKLQKKERERVLSTRFRILNLEEELYSIAKGLESAIPFDYSFMSVLKDNEGKLIEIRTNEFGIDFGIDQENGCDVNIKLLLGDRAVFYLENSAKPTLIFWDLKEKKKLDSVCVDLQKPLNNIIISKKSVVESDKIKLFLLDEYMNIYCGSISKKDGFVLNQTIIFPISVKEKEKEEEIKKQKEEEMEKLKELEAKYFLNFGWKKRTKCSQDHYGGDTYLPPDSIYNLPRPMNFQSSEKTRRYYQNIFNKTNEEWLIVHVKNNFHFINLDKGKIQEFSADKDIGLLTSGNWTVYEDNLLITNPTNILYYQINFEDHKVIFRFSRETKNLSVEKIGKQWIVLDSCFTVVVFTHIYQLGFTTQVTIIVTSTQEFLYNQDPAFNLISFKVQADHLLSVPDRLDGIDRYLDVKLENSKVLVRTKKASFYFDMNLSAQPYNKGSSNGWMSNSSIHTIRTARLNIPEARYEVRAEEEEKPPKQKMVNKMKLEGNTNNVNVIEKNDGWKKGGRGEYKKEEDKEPRVVKSKGDKYHKNIRQSQRSEKVN